MRSSLGFHTMTLSLSLEHAEVSKLINDFKRYSQNTGLIQMFHVDGKGTYSKYQHPNDSTILPLNLKISYYKEDRGIKWLIRYNTWSNSFKSYIVEAKINPKLLAGISDYITAATYDDMAAAITNFNLESGRISPILKTFDCYALKRIDYCINFYLNELIPECNAELVMNLIRRGNIPSYYKEWTEYDDTAHRKKSKPDSFYLINPSVNINCYNKYMQLLERSRENEKRGLSPTLQATLDAAKGIIRFEVQCKYHKTYTLSNRTKASEKSLHNDYGNLLSHETCIDIISYYFKKIIKQGDWYTLHYAIRKIESHNYNIQREKRLISALQLVNQCRSLAKAKTAYQGEDLKAFKRTIKDLSELNINPVTIPKEWDINYIPNLLYTYFDKVQEEKYLKEMTGFSAEHLNDLLKNHKKRLR